MTTPRTKGALAWSLPNLAGPSTLTLTSPDFDHDGAIPAAHAAHRVGGQDLSPELSWSAVPDGTARLLLVIEDPDAPTPMPFVHGLALLDPSVTRLTRGALNAATPAEGVRLLRSGIGSGYFGPAPPKSHGPHLYAFQLFALATPPAVAKGPLEAARPRDVLAGAGGVLARGRLDGTYRRT